LKPSFDVEAIEEESTAFCTERITVSANANISKGNNNTMEMYFFIRAKITKVVRCKSIYELTALGPGPVAGR